MQPCAEVQIIQEDIPLRTPRAAFGQLASFRSPGKFSLSRQVPSRDSPAKQFGYEDADSNSECTSVASPGSEHTDMWSRMSQTASNSCGLHEKIDEPSSSDEESGGGQRQRLRISLSGRLGGLNRHGSPKMSQGYGHTSNSLESPSDKGYSDHEAYKGGYVTNRAKSVYGAPMSYWPHWVYHMYDSYVLARIAAGNVSILSISYFPYCIVHPL